MIRAALLLALAAAVALRWLERPERGPRHVLTYRHW
jgi:hypothetical protein